MVKIVIPSVDKKSKPHGGVVTYPRLGTWQVTELRFEPGPL